MLLAQIFISIVGETDSAQLFDSKRHSIHGQRYTGRVGDVLHGLRREKICSSADRD